ncbi:uncharacterized protein PG986_002233 [Apiospora aurea]|uniref:Uncharacterized protein n=1 Tax=Apiospora aurea TaxID=335848 RepID=A0ABR1QZ17_9PEZI
MKGADLRRLQFDLNIQHHLSAITGRNTRLDSFAISAILSFAVSILSGPLIQRASSVTGITLQPVDIDVGINVLDGSFPDHALPANFSGWQDQFYKRYLFTPLFRDVSRGYANCENITLSIDACTTNTTCAFKLPAPGFDVDCAERLIPYNFNNLAAVSLNNNITVFNTSLYFGARTDFENYTTIRTTALFKSDPTCDGQMLQRECTLRLATVRYPVTVSDGIVILEKWRGESNETLKITQGESKTNSGYDTVYTGTTIDGYQSMLGGVYAVLDSLYTSSVNIRLNSKSYSYNVTGQSANNYLTSGTPTSPRMGCKMTWGDPTTDLVNTARELMFRSAIAYSNFNRTAAGVQRIRASQTRAASAYKSHFDYFGITVACMVLQALVISYMPFGWHRLGRDVSLDAFEIARAMGAPALQDASSNSRIDVALSRLRRDKFRYGELVMETLVDPRIGADQSQRIGQGTNSHELSEHGSLCEVQADNGWNDQRPRLGLDRAERVTDIRPGVSY